MITELLKTLDVEKIQSVTDAFYAASGIPSSIITVDGKILTGSGWQDACTKFHRKHPDSLKACLKSDTLIREGLLRGKKSVVYHCPHGLVDAAAPIIVDGQHIANYFTGQFLFHQPNAEVLRFFEEQAKLYGFDKEAYLNAIKALPIIPEERIESILNYLTVFAELIAESGYANLQNQRYSTELKKSNERLEKIVLKRTESLVKINNELKTEIELRKTAESVLSAERIKTINLLDKIPAFVYLLKADYSIAFANQRFKTAFGDDLTLPCYRLIQNRDAPCDPCPNLRVLKTFSPYEREWEHKGRTYHIFDYPFYDSNGNWLVLEMGIDITDRKITENKLRESEAQYKRLVEESPDILYRFSEADGGFYVSDKVEAILGYPAEYLMKHSFIWHNSIHPEDKKVVDSAIEQFRRGDNFKIEYRIKDAKGRWHWLYDRSIGRYFQGEAIVIEGLAMDITDRREAEEWFRTFFSLISDIFCIADKNGYFRMINPAALKILGYSEVELLSKPFLEFVHPDDHEKTLKIVDEQLSKGEILSNFRNRYICKDGSVKWLEWTAYPVIEQEIIFAVARDCTKRIEMESAVKDSEILLRNIFNTLEEAVMVISPERVITSANKAAQEIFGYSEEELLGQPTEILHVDHDHFIEFGRKTKKAFEKGSVAEFEFRAKRKSNEIFPTEHTVSLLKDSEKSIGLVSVVRDISERKKAEKTLQNTLQELKRSNTELEQFAYIASHDLQEPLRAIAGFLQLLQSRYSDSLDERGNHYIERTVNAAYRMQNLVNDILTLSRVNTKGSPFVITDLNLILKSALQDLEQAILKAHAKISCQKMPNALIDGSQIQSLLQNLIQNAIKYAGEKDPEIEIGWKEERNMFCFYVKDNGIGIDPKFHDRIFIIFQRLHTSREYQGTGLGLALCKKIVERHGGRIWVESTPEKGSTFYFTLPK
ncbi:MAG: PAS domain S-box protein [Desulfamplus sp.]|nr:PAS domain S-box protein [Desulfamplus sp.]